MNESMRIVLVVISSILVAVVHGYFMVNVLRILCTISEHLSDINYRSRG